MNVTLPRPDLHAVLALHRAVASLTDAPTEVIARTLGVGQGHVLAAMGSTYPAAWAREVECVVALARSPVVCACGAGRPLVLEGAFHWCRTVARRCAWCG